MTKKIEDNTTFYSKVGDDLRCGAGAYSVRESVRPLMISAALLVVALAFAPPGAGGPDPGPGRLLVPGHGVTLGVKQPSG